MTGEVTSERFEGPTRNGGVVCIAYYRDDQWHSVDKAMATRVELVELDAAGETIRRTYGEMRPRANRTGRRQSEPIDGRDAVPTPSDLKCFDEKLRALTNEDPAVRPFLCYGFPIGCKVFLVGVNPAVDIRFWPHWDCTNGCDKHAWLDAYRAKNGGDGPTRKRIEKIFKFVESFRCLETNIFSFPAPREEQLAAAHRDTQVFDFLLEAVRPRVMLIYGRSAVRHIAKLTQADLPRDQFTTVKYRGVTLDVIAAHHLSYQWSDAKVEELGHRLADRCRSFDRKDA